MANVEDSLVYALEFAKDTHSEDISFLLTKLAESGLNLCSATPSVNEGLTVFISISDERILSVARKCRMKTLEGKFLPDVDVAAAQERIQDDSSDGLEDGLADFVAKEERDPRTLFSQADILWLTRHEIDNVRASSKQSMKVGEMQITLFQGQSIVEKFMHKNIIEKLYPLHEPEDLKLLGHEWLGDVGILKDSPRALFKKQPLSDVRNYYGEGVAFYFAFLETLTWALLMPTVLGLIQLFSPNDLNYLLVFSTLYLLWSFGLMEWWKRKSCGLSFLWGTRNKYGGGQGEPRANYRGEFAVDPISGLLMPHYPRWKTLLKLYGVSLPIVFLCTLVAFWLMLESIWKEQLLMQWTSSWPQDEIVWQFLATCIVSIPTVIYAALVWVANLMYRKLANKLTEWENHRTESQFERNRVTKLVLFEFVNNFMSLFYIAFILQDLPMLKWQVVLMLIVFQVINQLTETLWPYITRIQNLKKIKRHADDEKDEQLTKVLEHLNVRILDNGHHRIRQARKESLLDPYEGTHEDYLELFIQFGYVVLFVVAYPLASLWAWINNVGELRVDAFKLIHIHKRPAPARVAHIGAWEPAFRMMCSIAVVSNCALIYIMATTDQELAKDESQPSNWWTPAFICISLDHVLLGVQCLLGILVPAVPQWVQVARARQSHHRHNNRR